MVFNDVWWFSVYNYEQMNWIEGEMTLSDSPWILTKFPIFNATQTKRVEQRKGVDYVHDVCQQSKVTTKMHTTHSVNKHFVTASSHLI